jgi:carbon monoxide dehydrogenase subunit G
MRRITLGALVFAGVLTTGGCLAAAAGGLGAGIYYSDRGAESLVAAPIDKVYAATQAAFRDLNIAETKTSTESSESGMSERSVKGNATDDREVSVSLKTEGSSTRVEVVVNKSAVTFDKDFAKSILEKIVKGSN